MWYLAVALVVSSVHAAHHAVPIMCHGNAYYNITFHGMWNNMTFDDLNFPSNAMFSPITAVSHSSEYQMWFPGEPASEGVKQVAETGNNSVLYAEVELEQEKEKVHDIFKTDGPVDAYGYGDPVSMVFTPKHHLGSFVSMIFPSPDWFVGVYNIDLCGSDTGKWMKMRHINLYAWDAGTDSGMDFESADDPTDPVEDISLLTLNSMSRKFATIKFELTHVAYEKKECEAMSEETYHVGFQGMWTMDSHPREDVPDNAMFSPIVVASHSDEYTMWAPGGTASPGVQTVAEMGPPGDLLGELEEKECLGVKDFTSASAPIAVNGSVDLYVDVDKEHPYISVISMIFPSPDWFVGISSINLCNSYFWNDDTIELSLQPWDAGTDSGATFSAANAVTSPQGTISLITTDHMVGDTLGSFYNRMRLHIQRLGTITLERKMDAERDYKNLVLAWKKTFEDYKMEFEKWKEEECMSS